MATTERLPAVSLPRLGVVRRALACAAGLAVPARRAWRLAFAQCRVGWLLTVSLLCVLALRLVAAR